MCARVHLYKLSAPQMSRACAGVAGEEGLSRHLHACPIDVLTTASPEWHVLGTRRALCGSNPGQEERWASACVTAPWPVLVWHRCAADSLLAWLWFIWSLPAQPAPQVILPRLPAPAASAVFSKNFSHALVLNLRKPDNYLHAMAKRVMVRPPSQCGV